MKEYLLEFLKEFDYEKSDANFLISALEKIEKNPKGKKLLEEVLESYEKDYKHSYHELVIDKTVEAANISGVHPYTATLLIHILMSKRLRELYSENGLDYVIFKDTVLDLKWKLLECKAVKGIVGISTFRWFEGFYRLERFALGRLQFELLAAKCDYEKNGIHLKNGYSTVINVHIPRTGEPIDKESCDASYDAARKFFKKMTGEDLHFVCRSWLLFPENKKIIPEKSNVYRFMSEYDIVSFEYNFGEDLWRLFDTEEKNPEKLPTDTTLRRVYVEHLKNGGRVGEGYGIKK